MMNLNSKKPTFFEDEKNQINKDLKESKESLELEKNKKASESQKKLGKKCKILQMIFNRYNKRCKPSLKNG